MKTGLILTAIWLGAVPLLPAQTPPQPTPTPAPAVPRNTVLGESAAQWPGTRLQVIRVERVANEKKPGEELLLFAIRLTHAKGGHGPIFLGEPSPTDPTRVTPFSLTKATLVDEQRSTRHPALSWLPTTPFFGPESVVTSVHPGQWIGMAVAFPAPPPVTDAQGNPLPQSVTLHLPGADRPIRRIPVPVPR